MKTVSCGKVGIMVPGLIIGLAILTGTLLIPGISEADPAGRLIEKGDWTVTGAEESSGEDLRMTGNLTVEGELVLRDCDLIMNLTSSGQFEIVVENDGRLVLENVTVRSINPAIRFRMRVYGELVGNNSILKHMSSMDVGGGVVDLFNTEMRDYGKTAVSAVSAKIVLEGCAIISVNPDNNGLDLFDSNLTMNSTTVKDMGTGKGIGLNVSGLSNIWMKHGGIYNFTTGVLFGGNFLEMNDTVLKDLEVGIDQVDGYSVVVSSRIIDDEIGISCDGSSTIVRDNVIQNGNKGVELFSCNSTLDENIIGDFTWGVWMIGSDLQMTDNTLERNTNALSWNASDDGTIEGNRFYENDKGLVIWNSTLAVKDCTMGSQTHDIKATDSDIDMINTSHATRTLDPDSSITVFWYLDIIVTGPDSNPVPEADVKIHDQGGGIKNLITDEKGVVEKVILKERQIFRYQPIIFTPHYIEASNGTAMGNKYVEVVNSGSVTLQLSRPDLYITDISHHPDEGTVGEYLSVNVTVATTVYPLDDIKIFIYLNQSLVTEGTMDLISDLNLYMFDVLPPNPGSIVIRIVLDPGNEYAEENEDNNEEQVTVPVKGNGGQNGDGLPDLHLIGISQSNENPLGGSTIYINVEIQNSGTAVANDVLVRLVMDGEEIGTQTIDTIAAGGIGTTSFEWEAEEGDHLLSVRIDPDNDIAESDETNNFYEDEITVGSNGVGNFDEFMTICLGIIIAFIFIITILIVIMAARSKKTAAGKPGVSGPQQEYGRETQERDMWEGGARQPSPPQEARIDYRTAADSDRDGDLSIVSRGTTPGRDAMGAVAETGAVCKRCGSQNIRYFHDGHKQCRDCRKIFF